MTELSPKLAHRASNSLTCQTSLCTRSLKMSANLCGDLIHDVMYQQVEQQMLAGNPNICEGLFDRGWPDLLVVNYDG
ncbi:hypothetical protein MTR_5g023950 [Medicago truncatula]|uniref:Uncharacterized protein n=1 Tax=Medicago truncatula TaxID=3880 RepID=G7K027_MEDTR|nr:hypothetical protein MTR_5g023950 [Medicago truncatula]